MHILALFSANPTLLCPEPWAMLQVSLQPLCLHEQEKFVGLCHFWGAAVRFGSDWLGQVGFWGFEQPGPIGCLLTTRIRQWIHINDTKRVIWGFCVTELWGTPRVCQRKLRMTTPARWRATRWAPTSPGCCQCHPDVLKTLLLLFQPLPESPASAPNGSVAFAQSPPLAVDGAGRDGKGLEEPWGGLFRRKININAWLWIRGCAHVPDLTCKWTWGV